MLSSCRGNSQLSMKSSQVSRAILYFQYAASQYWHFYMLKEFTLSSSHRMKRDRVRKREKIDECLHVHASLSYIMWFPWCDTGCETYISREEYQKDIDALRNELSYWQNTTINILKKHVFGNEGSYKGMIVPIEPVRMLPIHRSTRKHHGSKQQHHASQARWTRWKAGKKL